MFAPIGWANSTTPGSATTSIGSVTQIENFTSDGTTPLEIGFLAESSWSDRQNLVASDASGIYWVCNTTGIYNLRFSQNLTITNAADRPPDVPLSSSLLYMNTDLSGTGPLTGTLYWVPSDTSGPGQVSYEISVTSGIADDVLLMTMTTPVGFLGSTVIPSGIWVWNQWAYTNDLTEANAIYYNVYTVDADGVSNPVLVHNGSDQSQLMTSGPSSLYSSSQTVPGFFVANLTKRVQVRVFGNFGAESTMSVSYEGTTVSTLQTVLPQASSTAVNDTVNLRMTITSPGTTEFNQVLETSIPVSIKAGETLVYSSSAGGLVNVDAGSEIVCTVESKEGLVSITSGYAFLPSPESTLQWNLVAQGPYGNVGELDP